jgi:hypothetical protein
MWNLRAPQVHVLAKPQGVSQMNKVGGNFSDKYRSAASLTDSCNVINFNATVH